MEKSIEVLVANESHKSYIPDILAAIYEASKVKGNSIVMRDPDYLAQKMILVTMAQKQKGQLQMQNAAFMEQISKDPETRLLGDGVYYKVIEEGTGDRHPQQFSVVTCHYRGSLSSFCAQTEFSIKHITLHQTTFNLLCISKISWCSVAQTLHQHYTLLYTKQHTSIRYTSNIDVMLV